MQKVILFVVVSAVAAWSFGNGAQEPTTRKSPPRLADLGWMVGSWTSDALGGEVEENWSPIVGGTMMGTFRMTAKGKTRFVEFLLIEQEGDRIVLRFKHFNPGYIPWEEEPLVLELVEVRRGRAVFQRSAKTGLKRLVYESKSPDSMVATVESERNGEPGRFKISFRRGSSGKSGK